MTIKKGMTKRQLPGFERVATGCACPIMSPEGRYQGREARAQPHPSLTIMSPRGVRRLA
jgi:hypothetical protein